MSEEDIIEHINIYIYNIYNYINMFPDAVGTIFPTWNIHNMIHYMYVMLISFLGCTSIFCLFRCQMMWRV